MDHDNDWRALVFSYDPLHKYILTLWCAHAPLLGLDKVVRGGGATRENILYGE